MESNDANLRALIAAAKGIMAAADDDRKAAEKAIARLANLENRVSQNLELIPKVLTASADRLASATAEKAAGLLTEKFVKADAAAVEAARKYQLASENLKRRFWLTILGIHVGVIVPLALVFYLVIPSTDEIALRRGEVAALDQQIADLKGRGASAEFTTYKGQLYIRTKELKNEDLITDTATGKKTYRQVWMP